MSIETPDWTGVEDPYNPGFDFPTLWALQNEVRDTLEHDPKCSFIQAQMLCDCGALRQEALRRSEDQP